MVIRGEEMKALVPFTCLLLFAGAVFVCGCGPEETSSPAVPGQTESPGGQEPQEGKPAKAPQEGEQGEEKPAPIREGRIPFDRLWPDHPLARKILVDPYDDSQSVSYWRDAKVGDWCRFLNHRKNVIIFKVVEREGDKLKFTSKEYKRTGEEIPEEQLDIRDVDIYKNDEVVRGPLVGNPYIVRTVYEWQLYKSDKILYCARHTVDNPRGDNKETCWSRDVRCHGVVFQRSGRNVVVLLIDYGDADNPPKWDHLDPAELVKYWYEFDRFLDEKVVAQKDPQEGELPEKPEEPAPSELVKDLDEIGKLVGAGFSKALEDKRFKDVRDSLAKVGELLKKVGSYAEENNYLPALAELEKVNAKAGELVSAVEEPEADKTSKSLIELRGLLDRLYISVNYAKEKMQ